MGKSKRKINKLRRKMLKNKIRRRIPVAPPTIVMKTDRDYDRKQGKLEIKKLLKDDNG